MTAIFVVMNDAGLAIAADSAESVRMPDSNGESRTVFTQNVSKIYRKEEFGFAIAHAGDSTINRIPIEGIINRWLATCERSNTLEDYVESFIKWLAEFSLLEDLMWDYDLARKLIKRQLITLRSEIQERPEHNKSEIIQELFDGWEKSDPCNIYGFSPKKTEKFVNEKSAQLYSDFCKRFLDYRLRQDIYDAHIENLNLAFELAFDDVFESQNQIPDEEKEILKQRTLKFNIDHIDSFDDGARIMFAGYGEHDWLPKAIALDIHDFNSFLPKVSVRYVHNSESRWYMSLATSQAVDKFWRPVESEFESELREELSKKFAKKSYLKSIMDVIDEVVSKHEDDVVDPIRKKIRLLSVEKLAFIAKQMVAMESFNSFVYEYLPAVGGEIEVVKISRHGFSYEKDAQ